jgi:hypothetical protein
MSNILNNHFTTDPEVDYGVVNGVITESNPEEHLKINFPKLGNPQKHYDNSKGSLYKWCEEKGLNTYEFDIIKRIMRCRKKGQFAEDLQKTKDLIDIYLSEYET